MRGEVIPELISNLQSEGEAHYIKLLGKRSKYLVVQRTSVSRDCLFLVIF